MNKFEIRKLGEVAVVIAAPITITPTFRSGLKRRQITRQASALIVMAKAALLFFVQPPFVPADEIRANKYDLSISRYKEIEHKEIEYEKPEVIMR